MNKEPKLHFCQECQEMVFHKTDEHEESLCVEFYTRRLKGENEPEYGSGYSLLTLVV